MAPELIRYQITVPESDIWSLGCTIGEMLTGYPPLYGREVQNAMYLLSTMTELFTLPDGLDDVCL
jgi:serine/threonine protein kinase